MAGRPADLDLLGGLGAVAHLGVIANLSDAQLIDHFLARKGKGTGEVAEAAFEALVARHGAMVLDVCKSVLRDPHDAQDAFQATFLVLASRAGSIRQRETVAGWLLGVARRVSLRSRGDLARQRARESRAAEIRADHPAAGEPESWQELHDEIGRLPGRFREPVVLCYLEGLSADAAAARLGCPRGTVLSRLSRARERLRDRLTRRGLAPAFAMLEAGRLPATLPHGLVSTTVRASLTFADHATATAAAGLSTGTAVALARGVIRTMTISRLKTMIAALMIGALVPGGLWAFGSIPRGEQDAKPAATPRPGLPSEQAPGPAGVIHIDRIDFDQLYTGAIAEARPGFHFAGNVDPGLALRIDVPRFATVKDVRCLRSDGPNGAGVRCIVTIGLDTQSAGTLAGELKVRLGDREARLPVSAKVKPAEAGRPKVLMIGYGFGTEGDSAAYYRPWFDLARDAGLDVSYMSTDSMPAPTGPEGPPEELSRYDVILLEAGGVGLSETGAYGMRQLVQSGRRVIVIASPGVVTGPLYANQILEPMGLHMDDSRLDTGTGLAMETARMGSDRLLEGVRKLSCIGPAMIEVKDSQKARILAYLPDNRRGLVAVSRVGKGELVAIASVELAAWLGEFGKGTDNARFLKNLLTMKVGR